MKLEYMHACKFCGQMCAFESYTPNLTDEEKTEIVTYKCNCGGAARERWLIESEKAIDKALGEGSIELGMDYTLLENTIEFAKMLLPYICDDTVFSIQFKEPMGDVIYITYDEGKAKIRRNHRKQVTI